MKKLIFTVVLINFVIVCFAQTNNIIEGQVSGKTDSQLVILDPNGKQSNFERVNTEVLVVPGEYIYIILPNSSNIKQIINQIGVTVGIENEGVYTTTIGIENEGIYTSN